MTVYVSAWPGLSPALLLGPPRREPEPPFPLGASGARYFYVARYGIYQLFRALGFAPADTVLVPAYHHGNEVRAIRAAGARVEFYPSGLDLRADPDELEALLSRRPRALYLIHYLGWPQPVARIERLCRKYGVLLIEDCALSLLSETEGRPLGSFGDHAVFCLYKTLPVPNGGVLVQNRGRLDALERLRLRPCRALSIAGRTAELMGDWVRSRSDAAGRALFALKRAAGQALSGLGLARQPVGDSGFDLEQADVGMSPLSAAVLRRCDYAAVKAARRRNFRLLLDRLAGRVALLPLELEEGVCPLFFPVLVRDKARAAQELWRRGIGAVTFWNRGDPEAEHRGFEETRFLREHVLELPIHQDVTPGQIDYMADQVVRVGADAPYFQGLPWSRSNTSRTGTASIA
jgi:dTDP-4-amino-4,6-dideoxygalactose transaminase